MPADHPVDDPSARVPDGISPIVAYRCWAYERDGLGGRLGELMGWLGEGRSAWEGASSSRWVRASCRPFGIVPSIHEAPLETCTCGFYAVKALLTVLSMLPQIREHAAGPVLGKVQLAGKIVEHEYGYRAERARIAELIPIRGTERDVRRLGFQLRLKVGDPVLYRNPGGDGPSSPQLGLRSWVRAPLDSGHTTATTRLVA